MTSFCEQGASPQDIPESQRICCGCGQAREKESLVRLVLGPDGEAALDYAARLGGRGAYLCPKEACFQSSDAPRGLGRSFKCKVQRFSPKVLFDLLRQINRTRLLEDLRLALKAGAVISGGNTIEMELAGGRIVLLLLSDDASENTADRVQSWARRLNVPLVQALTQDEIGHVLGKDPRAAVAITAHAFARKFIRDGAIYDAILNRSPSHFTR